MPALEPYADHKKAELIAGLSTLPDGIQNFLEIELPTAPTISTPSDVDAAIVASGVLSKFLLDVFVPYAGLFLAALPLHVGQLNDWHNAGVLANLQQMPGAEDGSENSDLIVISPEEGGEYLPGELRIQVKARQGSIETASVTIDGELTELDAEGDTFWGLVHMPDEGAYTAGFLASFAEDRPIASADVAFSISSTATDGPAESGGQDDLKALDAAKKTFIGAARDLVTSIAASEAKAAGDLVVSAAQGLVKIGRGIDASVSAWEQRVLDKIQDLIDWTE